MTVAQLIRGLKKYHPNMQVVQGDVIIKAMRIHSLPFWCGNESVVRLIREDEKRA